MAITTLALLKTAIANWLGRGDLTDRIPEFIALAEQEIARNLRRTVVREALTIDAATETLPAGCEELRSIRLNTSTRQYTLNATTPEGLATLRRVGSGVPNAYAVVNGTILFDITPDTSYTAEIVYYSTLTPLTGDSTAITARMHDIYLYGALKEAAPYLEHDQHIPVWEAKFAKAVNDENIARERAELGSAPMVMRLPVVFG